MYRYTPTVLLNYWLCMYSVIFNQHSWLLINSILQGISYAKLASLPPIIGLCTC